MLEKGRDEKVSTTTNRPEEFIEVGRGINIKEVLNGLTAV